ncbi:Uu.00g138240.m01.CDS01 [Anthostomella pinea]|uniref:Uu.00g138240.m01.CDS01 n=1 Tax=Anthostomella pinea TaxID=933095 RepID=A0AAI8VPN3_9PEZI|nr:Uu.00g138240.m01.CDS01 [Anthostomella pinea]
MFTLAGRQPAAYPAPDNEDTAFIDPELTSLPKRRKLTTDAANMAESHAYQSSDLSEEHSDSGSGDAEDGPDGDTEHAGELLDEEAFKAHVIQQLGIPPSAEYSDHDVQRQPDIVAANQRLVMPLDGPRLRLIIHRVEGDRDLCFKMRWFVARHARKHFDSALPGSQQAFQRRVRQGHKFDQEVAIKLRPTPFNRLDFEVTRAQEEFSKGDSGWENSRLTQVLQRTYSQYGWSETVSHADVDLILMNAGANPGVFASAARIQALVGTTTGEMPPPRVHPGIAGKSRRSTSRRPPRGASHQDTPRDGLMDEIQSLRAEVRDLKEAFVAECRASQQALVAEMRLLREAMTGAPQRKRK